LRRPKDGVTSRDLFCGWCGLCTLLSDNGLHITVEHVDEREQLIDGLRVARLVQEPIEPRG